MEIKAITSLRFFAALMVVLSHLTFLANSESPLLSDIYRNVLSEGYIGVTFFFILSGFILSHSYANRIAERRIGWIDFIALRIARIFPVHLLTFILAIPLIDFKKSAINAVALLPNVLLVQSYFPYESIYFSVNAPSWSLSNELFFYALFPVLILKGSRFLIFSAIFSVVLHGAAILLSSSISDALFLAYIFPPSRLIDFVIGICIYRLRVCMNLAAKIKNPVAFQIFSLVSLGVFFMLRDNSIQALRYDLYYIVPMALIVTSFSLQSGAIAHAMSNRFLVLLGNASFSLYLTHQLVIRYGNEINVSHLRQSGIAYDISASVLYVLLSVAVSILVYISFEQKAKAFVSYKLGSLIKRYKVFRIQRRALERVKPDGC